MKNIHKAILTATALATFAVTASGAAQAQQYPAYRSTGSTVAYQAPEVGRYRVRGWVSGFGGFDMTVRAEGREVAVRLHQGTVILPTGLTLRPGMFVSVEGYWNDGRFHADRIALIR